MKKIFVSSTFKDMQAERDALHLEVLPELNEFAARYGQSVAISDLRWGIETGRMSEEESSRKVLSVCFEQIDECKPYMVVLLGERYGFIPYTKDDDDGGRTITGVGDAAGMSVTEMEILYGALQGGDLSRCVFYFRQPLDASMIRENAGDYCAESGDHARRLNALKQKIEAAAGTRVRHYAGSWDPERRTVTGLEDFTRMVTDDIKALMAEEWERDAQLTKEELEWNAAWQYVRLKAVGFTARGAEETALCGDIRNDAAELFFITGEAGSGKSCFLSMTALDMRKAGWKVMPFIAGNGGGSSTASDLLRQLNAFLARETGDEATVGPGMFSALHDEFARLAERYAALDQRLLVAIDALGQMAFSDELRDFTWLIPALPKNIRFVISCLNDFPLPKGMPFTLRDKRVVLQPLHNCGEKQALIAGMTEAFGKALSPDVMEALVSLPAADSPLYLSMFIQRLLMLDSEDFRQIQTIGKDGSAISAYMLRLIREAPASTAGICAAIIREAGQRINETQIEPTLGLLAVSRRGLRETDLIALFDAADARFSTVDHARMRKYMRSYFLLRGDGRLDFSHRTIRDGFMETQPDAAMLERRLLNHWISLPSSDLLRQSELPFHAMRLDDKDSVLSMIENGECTEITLRELHDLSMTDRAGWLIALIDHAQADGRIVRLISTILKLHDEYDATAVELAALTPLLEKAVSATEHEREMTGESEEWSALLGFLWFDLGKAYYDQGMPAKAQECYQKREALVRKATKTGGTPKAEKTEAVADAGVTVDGERYTQKETAWLGRANLQEERGHTYNRLNQLDEALACYRESHELMLRLLPQADRHPSVWQALAVGCSELCRTYRRLRKVGEARPYAEEGIQYAKKAVEKDPCTMSSRTLSALYGDLGDVLFLEQRWEESYDTFSLAYSIAEEIMREKNDAQSRQDLAFSARKRGDALARMHAGSRAKALYIESIRLVAYEPEELMSPSSRRMLLDTATNFGFLRFMDFEADALLYNAVANLLKLLEGFEDVPAGSRQYTVNLGLLCDSLSTVVGLASCKEDAEALRIKAGEYLGEERADSIPEDTRELEAQAERAYLKGSALLKDGRFADARKVLQQAAELYTVLDKRQPAFTPSVAKGRTDAVLRLAQTYFPEKNYGEIAGCYNFCNSQYERIYETTQSDEALLDLAVMKRSGAELLEELQKHQDAIVWINAAEAMLGDLKDSKGPELALPVLIETAKRDMTAAALSLTGEQERKRLWKRAEGNWRQAYRAARNPEYLEQAQRCAARGTEK